MEIEIEMEMGEEGTQLREEEECRTTWHEGKFERFWGLECERRQLRGGE